MGTTKRIKQPGKTMYTKWLDKWIKMMISKEKLKEASNV